MFLPAGMQREGCGRPCPAPVTLEQAATPRSPNLQSERASGNRRGVPCENHSQPGCAGAQAGAQCPVSKDRKKRAGQGRSDLQETPARPVHPSGSCSANLQALPATGRPAPPPGPGVQRRCGERRKSPLLRTVCTPMRSLHGRCLQSVNTPSYRWIKHFQRPRL